MNGLAFIALPGLPEIAAGDDLAAAIAKGMWKHVPRAFDVLVVAQKVVSKAEGRTVDLRTVSPSPEAEDLSRRTGKDARLVEVVLRESQEVVRVAPNVLITRHRRGYVMANAGVDRSNVPGSTEQDIVLLLPEDPDASAARLQDQLAERFDIPAAVIISDSFGRPWRNGVVNVALGVAGLPAIVDRRGERDREGRTLEMTEVALADAIAAGAGLAMGEAAEGTPVVLVRGLRWSAQPSRGAALLRPKEQDLFR